MHNPSEQSLLSGDMILPPEAHRTRSGDMQITMLMDNYYGWNTMDFLSIYYTDYDLNESYTNWDHNNLAEAMMQIWFWFLTVIGWIIITIFMR